MRFVEGREHFHGEYKGPRDVGIYERDFLPGFAGWNEAARAVWVEVVNATKGSALKEFPFMSLDEVLR
jgi:hypothetical protein